MNDAASVTSLCRKVLFEYHPLEPEMILQLTGATFRQWDFGTVMGGRRSVRAPRPSNPVQPEIVNLYMASKWRREDMSFLEFLRKSDAAGATGKIAGWLRKRWAQRPARQATMSLEAFANAYTMQGEQVVAVEYLWRMNDGFYGQWSMMHVPFRSLEIFQNEDIESKVPARYRWLATALLMTDDPAVAPLHLRGYWRDPRRIAEEMKLEAYTDAFINDVNAFVGAHVLAIDRYMTGQLDRNEEQPLAAVAPRPNDPASGPADVRFEGKQAVLHRLVAQRVEVAMEANAAPDETVWEQFRKDAGKSGHRPIVCSGRPGTGKTTVLHRNVRETLAAGGSVLVTIPTARQSTRMAAKLGAHERLVVETAAAAFQFHKPEQEAMYAIYGYDLVVVDEFSQLAQWEFERILRLWRAADQLPALVFAGDKYQLPGVDPRRPWESQAWNATDLYFIELTEIFRADDPKFLETLDLLRTAMPSKMQLNSICRGRKAWVGDEPNAADIGALLRKYPQATVVAATKRGVALINQLALEALHPRAAPLATIPGAFEDNPDNSGSGGKLRDDRRPVPTDVPLYRGLRLYLTRNVRKADDYVNGMPCVVKSWDESRNILWVQTESGKRLPITPWHDPDHPGLVYFPVRLGYCTTVRKIQGDEFPFIIIYLDTPNMPALACTAISRVKNGKSYLLGGHLEPEHFTPVTMR